MGLPRWQSDKESAYQCRRCKRHGLNPWVWKINWHRKWQPTPGFLPVKFHGQRSLAGYRVKHNWLTECSCTHTHIIIIILHIAIWASLVGQTVKNLPSIWETWVQYLGWEIPCRMERLPTPVFFPGDFLEHRSLAG